MLLPSALCVAGGGGTWSHKTGLVAQYIETWIPGDGTCVAQKLLKGSHPYNQEILGTIGGFPPRLQNLEMMGKERSH